MEEVDAKALEWLEESTRDANRLQLQTLRSILERNAQVSYLRPYLRPCLPSDGGGDGNDHVSTTIDADTFRRLVPISSYEDYAPLIQQMADGSSDSSVLSFDPLLCFFYSSGTTTMKPKMVPFFDSKYGRASSQLAHQASSAILRRLVPPRTKTSKILWLLYAGTATETKCGLIAMAATAYPMQSKGQKPSPLFDLCISPSQVLLGSDTHQQMYCHLLCGLRRFDLIDGIRAPYAIGLVRALRLLQSKWEQLCEDIESGSVASEITDPAMRAAVEEFLGGPQPDVANRIREICRVKDWGGVIAELWPELRFVACVSTGSMEQYYPLLKHFTGESIPLLGGDYFASECAIGISMDRMLPPQLTRYVVLPSTAYFEFLPFELDSGKAGSGTVDISGVEVGKIYEVVVTTYRGLYRYRLGDIVRVTGFYNSSPQLGFVSRAPKNASEIFTERDLMSGMESFQQMLSPELGGDVIEYTGFVDSDTDPKHVMIFVEINRNLKLQQEENREELVLLLQRCCPVVESCLGSAYKVKRANGDLGPVEISIVKPGSFDELMKVAIENGAPASQYKPPKILRNTNLVLFLKESAVVSVNSDVS